MHDGRDPNAAPEPPRPHRGHRDKAGFRRAVGPLLLIAAAIGTWFVVDALWKASKEQDCIMAGHKNCVPLDTSEP